MLTPDSIVPDPANPQSFNRYSYVENRPINFSDPTGHFSFDQIAEMVGYSEGYDSDGNLLTAGQNLLNDFNNLNLSEGAHALVLALRAAQFGDVIMTGWNPTNDCNCLTQLMFVAQGDSISDGIWGLTNENMDSATVSLISLDDYTFHASSDVLSLDILSWAIFRDTGFNQPTYSSVPTASMHFNGEEYNPQFTYDYRPSVNNEELYSAVSVDAVWNPSRMDLVGEFVSALEVSLSGEPALQTTTSIFQMYPVQPPTQH